MKQGKIYNKIITALVVVALLSYLVYAVYRAVSQPLSTVVAVEYEAGAGSHTSGYVVREETALTSPYPITVLSRREGEKVGEGQPLATGYQSSGAQERQNEIDALQTQLTQLQYASSYNYDPSNLAALDAELTAELLSYRQHVTRRDMTTAVEMGSELKGMVLRRESDATDFASIQSQISSVSTQLNALRAQGASETTQIAAEHAGYFSAAVDGYESVLTPARIKTITVSELASISASVVSDQSFGRLITDAQWYYVTVVPTAHLAESTVGDTVQVSFASEVHSSIEMRITRISEEDEGYTLVVLSAADYIQNVSMLRSQNADIIFTSYSGIRVPKRALHLDEKNNPGVFVLEATRAKWKNVTILHDNGESYIVALDKSSTDNLWPGESIITDANDLYDGKVVVIR